MNNINNERDEIIRILKDANQLMNEAVWFKDLEKGLEALSKQKYCHYLISNLLLKGHFDDDIFKYVDANFNEKLEGILIRIINRYIQSAEILLNNFILSSDKKSSEKIITYCENIKNSIYYHYLTSEILSYKYEQQLLEKVNKIIANAVELK